MSHFRRKSPFGKLKIGTLTTGGSGVLGTGCSGQAVRQAHHRRFDKFTTGGSTSSPQAGGG